MSFLNWEAWGGSLTGKFWNADGNPDAWRDTYLCPGPRYRIAFNHACMPWAEPAAERMKYNRDNYIRFQNKRGWPKNMVPLLLTAMGD